MALFSYTQKYVLPNYAHMNI